jgi:hypothetical protein
MSSTTIEGLNALLASAGESRPVPHFASADISNNVIHIFVSYLADYIVQSTGCTAQTAYDCLKCPSDGTADLVAVLPQLRLDGGAQPLVSQLVSKVLNTPKSLLMLTEQHIV